MGIIYCEKDRTFTLQNTKKYNNNQMQVDRIWIFVTSILREENRWMYGLSSDIL